MKKLDFKEYYFLNSVMRYEKLFGPKGYTLTKEGKIRSERVAYMVECGYMEINENNELVVSEVGKKYLETEKPWGEKWAMISKKD